jgi:F-type H+-transporting ATPase subunit b
MEFLHKWPFILEFPKEVNNVQWLIVRLVGLLLVFWIIKKFIWPSMIRTHLVDRHTAIVEADQQVQETMRETADMRNDYRARLEGIEHETQRRLDEAVHEAETLREQILAEAHANAQAIVRRGEEEVSRERAKAMLLLRRQFVEDVVGAAQYAAARSLGAPQQRRLVEEFTKELGSRS